MSSAHEATATEPSVLELRVHGVNNTPPAAFLDLPPRALRQVRGDKRSAFWLAAPTQNPPAGARGHVPDGIRREAYSWGGLVRTQSRRATRMRAAALAFQVLALPFSIGNGAMWTRQLPTATDRGAARVRADLTAGAARVFGLALTLLFTTTAITICVDLLALQCAVAGECSAWPWELAWGIVMALPGADAFLTPSRIVALLALGPVLAVGLLVAFARITRLRYDTLHEHESAAGEAAREAMARQRARGTDREAPRRSTAVLAEPAFWSNRSTAPLALVHLAAALALTAAQVSFHIAAIDRSAAVPRVVLWAAATVLGLALVAVAILPTMTVTPSAPEGPRWSAWLARSLLALAILVLAVLLGMLVAPDAPDLSRAVGLRGDALPPLVIITLAAALAVSGAVWRAPGARSGTAWVGCAPAVFMVLSLTLGALTSAAVLTLTAIVVDGWGGPAALVDAAASGVGLHVPHVFLAVGGLIALAMLVSAVVVATFLIPRKLVADRATTWHVREDATPLAERLDRQRRRAALIHLAEPAAGISTALLAIAIGIGLVWAWVVAIADASRPVLVDGSGTLAGVRVTTFLVFVTWALTIIGVALAVVIALGVLLHRPGLLAIVWDVTCFLPRTAQPFGPPCYAEHAVPDVVRALDEWLSGAPQRRAVLAAHSMGGVIAVSALALLAATTKDPTVMRRVSLLTFGVQLRAFFGRLMPELVGPAMLGTYPARSPRPWRADPWSVDALDDDGRAWSGAPTEPSIARLGGALLPEGVPWINLWRLSDYLGCPAVAGSAAFRRGEPAFENAVDRYAQEIDRTAEPPAVLTHNDYFRAPAYAQALLELARGPDAARAVAGPASR